MKKFNTIKSNVPNMLIVLRDTIFDVHYFMLLWCTAPLQASALKRLHHRTTSIFGKVYFAFSATHSFIVTQRASADKCMQPNYSALSNRLSTDTEHHYIHLSITKIEISIQNN